MPSKGISFQKIPLTKRGHYTKISKPHLWPFLILSKENQFVGKQVGQSSKGMLLDLSVRDLWVTF